MPLTDIAANLTSDQFDRDRDKVIQRALDAGVERLVVVGTTLRESRFALELARSHTGVMIPTVGVHPHDAGHLDDAAFAELAALAAEPDVRAVGECGLDFNRDWWPRDVQARAFQRQIDLALEVGKPLYLHEREAADALIEQLVPVRERLGRVVVHCFTGEAETLERYLDLDFYIGITGWICDERRGGHLHELVTRIPADRLMIETDAPYLLPRTLRPKPKSRRNEPSYLPEVARVVADLRGVTPEELATQTTATAATFFGI
ncbi:MAG: TatD family hydrolase [Planctomycetota bacterium]|jgi:TatD DNase family protein